jgi:diguanylate cyclase (GGDEF)-like protein
MSVSGSGAAGRHITWEPRSGSRGRYLTATVLVGIVVILAAMGVTGDAIRSAQHSRDLADRGTLTAIEADRVHDLLVGAESAQHGFVLTGRDDRLAPYHDAVLQLPGALESLQRLTADSPANRQRARQLGVLAEAKMAEVSRAIDVRRAQGLAPAVETMGNAGRDVMLGVRSVDRDLQRDAEQEISVAEAAAERAASRALWMEAVASVLLLGLLVSMLLLLRQRARLQQRNVASEQERRVLVDQLSHVTTHDALTGLPNRRLAEDRVAQALVRSASHQSLTALLVLDLDGFKYLNDGHGQAVGDRVLVETAHRLRTALGPTDTLARVGADEFVVLREEVADLQEVDQLARRLEDRVCRDLRLSGRSVRVTASIGYVLVEHDRVHGDSSPRRLTAEFVLAAGEAALQQAKDSSGVRRHLYDAGDARQRTDRTSLLHDLGQALPQGQLHVVYQPLVDLATAQPIGVEALLRWNHPQRGPVSPVDFIPVAEDSGLILPIGAFVLEQACRQAGGWNAERRRVGLPPLRLTVNCSARQLLDPDFLDILADALEGGRLTAGQLTLELTESVLVDSVNGAADRLEEIAARGVGLSLDDFGTGYSSLSYLRRFPVNLIKIDRSFVSGVERSDVDEAIIGAVVSLANRLGRHVVAEGIETAEQAAAVAELGCHYGQGYFYGRPSSPEQLVGLLTTPAAALAGS